MKLNRKIVFWALLLTFLTCVIYGSYNGCCYVKESYTAYMKRFQKQDVGLGYTPPPEKKEVKDE